METFIPIVACLFRAVHDLLSWSMNKRSWFLDDAPVKPSFPSTMLNPAGIPCILDNLGALE